jgi:23S rRNA pseudouridine1911/1915/1917 synthase
MELKHIAGRSGRLSSFLLGEMKMSTGLMNRLKWGDAIRVDGVSQHTDFSVVPGNVITVALEEPEPEYPAEQGYLGILYEDDHILAVDKPAGMLIHPSRSQFDGTLANLVVGHYQATGQRSAFHPVTRLDRDTFGVVLLAKNSHVHQLLQATAVRKVYHALVLDGPREDAGVIDAPIARRPLPSLLRYVGPEGKPSVTEFQVLARDGALCKLELRPVTGRTHQLRVHCAYMGFPILGDPQYHNERSRKLSAAMELDSQLLCARELRFVHPMTGEDMVLVSRMEVK